MNLLKGEDRSFKALIARKPWLLPVIFLLWGLGFILNNYSHGDEARQLSSISESGVLNSAGIFVNKKAGFSITPPSGWHIGYGSKIDGNNKMKSFGEITGRKGRDLAMLVIESPDRSGRLMITGRYINGIAEKEESAYARDVAKTLDTILLRLGGKVDAPMKAREIDGRDGFEIKHIVKSTSGAMKRSIVYLVRNATMAFDISCLCADDSSCALVESTFASLRLH